MTKRRMDEGGRECCVCGEYKPWDEYNKNKNGQGGRDNRCRECMRAFRTTDESRKANRERQQRDYADPEKKAKQVERMRAYYAKPGVMLRMRSEEWRYKNRLRAKAWRGGLRSRGRRPGFETGIVRGSIWRTRCAGCPAV